MIVLVEPHSDDVWLSLGQHLLDGFDDDVTIVTVYGSATRQAEAAAFADWVGAAHVGLGVPEGGPRGVASEWTTELPSGLLSSTLDDLAATRVIGPLGLQHPEHRAVAEALPYRADRYVEFPYAKKQKLSVEANALMQGRAVVSWRSRSARANSCSAIFKSQSTFWLYNREAMTGSVELILK